jgi:hypothetical protein
MTRLAKGAWLAVVLACLAGALVLGAQSHLAYPGDLRGNRRRGSRAARRRHLILAVEHEAGDRREEHDHRLLDLADALEQ